MGSPARYGIAPSRTRSVPPVRVPRVSTTCLTDTGSAHATLTTPSNEMCDSDSLELGPLKRILMLHRHHDPAVVTAMETWFAHVLRYSRRDQLSLWVALRHAALEPHVHELDNFESPYHRWPVAIERDRGRGGVPWMLPEERLAVLETAMAEAALRESELETAMVEAGSRRSEIETPLAEALSDYRTFRNTSTTYGRRGRGAGWNRHADCGRAPLLVRVARRSRQAAGAFAAVPEAASDRQDSGTSVGVGQPPG